MTKRITDEEAITQVMDVLKEAFGAGVDFELFKESDTAYRLKATAEGDAFITDGLDALKASRLRSTHRWRACREDHEQLRCRRLPHPRRPGDRPYCAGRVSGTR
jgi:hypothetical protein